MRSQADVEKASAEVGPVRTNVVAGLVKRRVFHILAIAIMCAVVYSNSFHVPFLFDDIPNIVENPLIKNISFFADPSGYCSNGLTSPEQRFLCDSLRMRYLGYLTLAVNYAWHGLDVRGYHILNLTIHVANALLVYFLLVLIFKTPALKDSKMINDVRLKVFIPFFSAMIFAVHPVQTEAVTYVVQRLTSLATLFFLASIAMYFKWRTADSKYPFLSLSYISAILCAVLAMKTKEIAFTLPVMIGVAEFIFFDGKVKRRILYLTPFLFTMLIIPVSLIGAHKSGENLLASISESTRAMTTMSRWDYMLTQLRVVMTYIRLIFLPVNQNLDYDYTIYHSLFNIPVFMSFLFLLSLFLCAIYLLYRSRRSDGIPKLISFGILWFFITLSVESSFIPIADVIFEHRLYLPSVGIIAAIVSAIFYCGSILIKGHRSLLTTEILLVIIIIALSGATYMRNMVWRNEITMWSDVVSKSPRKARGYNNLGFAYGNAGLYDKAIENLTEAIRINPAFDDAYYNRGNIYAKLGQYNNAVRDYTSALAINQDYFNAYNNRGVVYSLMGEADRAIDDFSRSIALNPEFTEAYLNRALSYHDKGVVDVPDFRRACILGNMKSCEILQGYTR
jgi:tetratricopeptide (TPR) repeat protein